MTDSDGVIFDVQDAHFADPGEVPGLLGATLSVHFGVRVALLGETLDTSAALKRPAPEPLSVP